MKIVRWWAMPVTVVATVLMAACGGGNSGTSSSTAPSASVSAASTARASVGSPPAALAQRINSALAKATSVHVAAVVSQRGVTVTVNLSLTRANDVYGQMTYKGAPFTVLVTQGHPLVKVTGAALKTLGLPSAACVLMCNKYLKLTAGQSKGITGNLGWSALVGPATSLPHMHYVRTTTVHGQPAWQMRAGSAGTIYVAAQGPPYPLRVVSPSGSNHIDYTQWNSVTIPPPPPASQVVDLGQLSHP